MIVCKTIEKSNRHGHHHSKSKDNTELHESSSYCSVDSTSIDNIVDTVTLDETDRNRRRFMLCSDSGIEFLLELPSVTRLVNDDILRLEDGRGIRVQAKPEALYEIRGKDALHLLRLTWHIGNRHLATQILTDHVRIRSDPVICNMLEQLGAKVTAIQAGFNPVSGAYAGSQSHHDAHHEH